MKFNIMNKILTDWVVAEQVVGWQESPVLEQHKQLKDCLVVGQLVLFVEPQLQLHFAELDQDKLNCSMLSKLHLDQIGLLLHP